MEKQCDNHTAGHGLTAFQELDVAILKKKNPAVEYNDQNSV